MFYFKFTADTPICGTEHIKYHEFKERPTDAELDEIAEELAQINAESYEYIITGWGALGKLVSPPEVVGSDTCLGTRMGDRRADYWRERVIVV